MNEKNENVVEENLLQQADSAQPAPRLPSRRRLIKLGAAGVPVVATLASSPAMAWDCRLPSAWGSAVVASQATAARNAPKSIEGCWSIANWANNTTRAGLAQPWKVVKAAPFNVPFSSYTTVTLGALLDKGAIAILPRGMGRDTVAYNVLSNGSAFSKAILVALLNAAVAPDKGKILTCTSGTGPNRLIDMANGTFYPSGGSASKPWSDDMVLRYLNNNYIAWSGGKL